MSTLDEMKRKGCRMIDAAFEAEAKDAGLTWDQVPAGALALRVAKDTFEGFADQLVTMIEKKVVPEKAQVELQDSRYSETAAFKAGYNFARGVVLAHFRAFRGIKE